jgi:hypothetical protein
MVQHFGYAQRLMLIMVLVAEKQLFTLQPMEAVGVSWELHKLLQEQQAYFLEQQILKLVLKMLEVTTQPVASSSEHKY